MRELTLIEQHSVSGAAFIEGFVTDDFAVWGAGIGLVAGLGMYYIAHHHYNNNPAITWQMVAGCVVGTAREGIKYGLVADALCYAFAMISP